MVFMDHDFVRSHGFSFVGGDEGDRSRDLHTIWANVGFDLFGQSLDFNHPLLTHHAIDLANRTIKRSAVMATEAVWDKAASISHTVFDEAMESGGLHTWCLDFIGKGKRLTAGTCSFVDARDLRDSEAELRNCVWSTEFSKESGHFLMDVVFWIVIRIVIG